MREKKRFNSRTKPKHQTARTIFLMLEGGRTEPRYFQHLSDNLTAYGFLTSIELQLLEKEGDEKGFSNPLKMYQMLMEYVEDAKKKKVGWNRFKYLLKVKLKNSFSSREWAYLFQEMEQAIDPPENRDDRIYDFSVLYDKLLDHLCAMENQPKKLIKTLNSFHYEPIDFDFVTDSIYLICDRDQNSFSKSQYQTVLNSCHKNDICFCPTNPCFEFWLLLHLQDIENSDVPQFLKNAKVEKSKESKSKISFCEQRLRSADPSFSKTCYDPKKYVQFLEMAVQRAEALCTDSTKLVDQVGSAIANLIRDMQREPW